MKAIVHEEYGPADVLQIRELEKPVPTDEQLLVRVRASSLNILDWYGMIGLFLGRPGAGWLKPKDIRIGTDFAGVVEGVGSKVTQFKPGDEIFGVGHGALAEYITVREDKAALKPKGVTFEQAASLPVAGTTALQGLRDHGQLQAGQHVLVYGAGGAVGSLTVPIAKALGAQVTAVCGPGSVETARASGADHVIDYTREDFSRRGVQYDLLLNINGGRPWSEYQRVLKPGAIFVLIGAPKNNIVMGPLGTIIRLVLSARLAGRKLVFFVAKLNKPDLELLADMVASGKLKPAIDQTYPLSQAADAMRQMGTGHIPSKIVVTVP
jgi:NADPH:quinone reductase-like Zn-dependent oxidoreductase